ncbi:TonB-dependent receptor [Polaribacter sp. Hel_I_88]|uniref:TonB-dependent receptor n=1 Tax=Polaribacter sp. Hel_I_88 TaxID=1250006 RepID=UPI00047B4F89|nr:TonB-dependent receptor [Polaribacter sp. Hel_I_88]
MKYLLKILLLLLFISMSSLAQKNTFSIAGKVTDELGYPLFGASVAVKNTNFGTTTDFDGVFKIEIKNLTSIILEFSYLGFQKQTKIVDFKNNSKQIINIVLKESADSLEGLSIVAKSKIRRAREQAYAVNVVKAAELFNTGANINEVLNKTSGVRIREDGGLGSNFSFSLNGFSGKQVKFFLDGIPIDNFGSSLTLNNFPISLASSIEIYKGVLPITLGSDALGGAVNIVSRTTPNYLDVSYGLGSFNTHKANVNYAYTLEKSGFTVRSSAFYNFSDNNYSVKVQPINLQTNQRLPLQEVERFHDNYKSATAQINIGFVNKSFADNLLVGFIASGNDKEIQTGVTMNQVFGGRTSNSSAFITSLKYDKTDIFTKNLDFKMYAAFNKSKNQFRDTTRLRYNWLQETIPTSTAESFRTQLLNNDDEFLVTSNLAYKISDIHSISLNYQFIDFSRSSSDVENPDTISFQFPQQLQKQTFGFAHQAKWQRFNITTFAKYYLLDANSFDTSVTSNLLETRQSSLNNFGYGFAATYFILPKLQIKSSFERAFRLPESVELLGDGLFTRRNANLLPEESYNFNLGVKYESNSFSNHIFNFETNYFLRNTNDYIRLDQAQSQPVDRQFINIGKVFTNGFEVDLQYRWKQKLRISANATYQNIIDKQEFITTTNLGGTIETPNLNFDFKVPNIPFLYGNLNVDYSFKPSPKNNKLNIGYSLNYVEEYFFTPNQLGANNQDNIPTQLSHNAMVSYEIDEGKYNISLEARNITNQDLFDNYLLQKPGRSFFINFRYYLEKQ